ncbi:alpha/beta fold hydrolase [Streptomyces sp. AV19]|uniref:alpha/beta hydrolase n=1 Tax=Streptomyces sp. AV19 TaxID=2793068 RepID=UPI0018FE652D|nr:alpha/beta fold hydrolase [Streptomyces sp. AV19]MBH1937845.1 alpha/beta fold hydrolase [Streptomyces sp. AV19]MDG4537123.1 lysophospholipase [Streptomyces sp. AV19]
MAELETTFRSLDGTTLLGTSTVPDEAVRRLAVLVHGAGVTRHEGGFFTRIAAALAQAGVRSLRFDLRAHGASGGRPEDITITGVANDIRAAADHLRHESGLDQPVAVIAASFSGGAAALHAAHRPQDVRHLVLLYPRLDYRERYITSRPYVDADGYLSPQAAQALETAGFTERSPFALGRALLNEVHYLSPQAILPAVTAPALLVHGTKDTFVPVESSRRYVRVFGGPTELMELDGAEHGCAVHEDPRYLHPQTKVWQAEVIDRVTAFLTT